MSKKKAKKKSIVVERLQRSGAGMASTTKGRARRFTDRKKEAARKACRGNDE
jgi:hypothetical protein